MQVIFVGGKSKIDMRPSGEWLKEKTSHWPWKTHIREGAQRDEALSILSREGVLLVLGSLIENMPYVVAEAAVSFLLLLCLPRLRLHARACRQACMHVPGRW